MIETNKKAALAWLYAIIAVSCIIICVSICFMDVLSTLFPMSQMILIFSLLILVSAIFAFCVSDKKRSKATKVIFWILGFTLALCVLFFLVILSTGYFFTLIWGDNAIDENEMLSQIYGTNEARNRNICIFFALLFVLLLLLIWNLKAFSPLHRHHKAMTKEEKKRSKAFEETPYELEGHKVIKTNYLICGNEVFITEDGLIYAAEGVDEDGELDYKCDVIPYDGSHLKYIGQKLYYQVYVSDIGIMYLSKDGTEPRKL